MKICRDISQKRAVVHCTNPAGLIHRIMQHRQVSASEVMAKIGIDGGGSFLKVCLGVVRLPQDDEVPGARLRLAGVPRCAQFKDGGVKKLCCWQSGRMYTNATKTCRRCCSC